MPLESCSVSVLSNKTKALKVVHPSNTVSFLWLFLSNEHLTAPFLFPSLNLRREGPTLLVSFPDIIPQPWDSEEKGHFNPSEKLSTFTRRLKPQHPPTQPPYRNANYSSLGLNRHHCINRFCNFHCFSITLVSFQLIKSLLGGKGKDWIWFIKSL